jgi:hypothetical protein
VTNRYHWDCFRLLGAAFGLLVGTVPALGQLPPATPPEVLPANPASADPLPGSGAIDRLTAVTCPCPAPLRTSQRNLSRSPLEDRCSNARI